eukprot:CAMPEP_0197643232 /NCGR_PEP_ID=MMETSP1338-20131121/16628_1 /TAXON_ID=43686 ORGANISM="Pelagodinium beii, Strain RCC1491" /NCGR_SAMPLE_ID=MMETSP1338 /ASSEMBLY_ACC=CAM_ASM_000754 /LENGTH=222 /DNA_ID=CAMNT_0043216463 /DNA_START=296 /DNA_END=964 /DNA_ORIENTATION=+
MPERVRFCLAAEDQALQEMNKCVDGFDHHCLWLNTCVGARNYRLWLAFIVVLWAWAVLGSCITFSALVETWNIRSRRLAVGHRPAVLVSGLGSALAACWLMLLLCLHAYFAYKGITTLEWAKSAPEAECQDNRLCRCIIVQCQGSGLPCQGSGLPLPVQAPEQTPEQRLEIKIEEDPSCSSTQDSITSTAKETVQGQGSDVSVQALSQGRKWKQDDLSEATV